MINIWINSFIINYYSINDLYFLKENFILFLRVFINVILLIKFCKATTVFIICQVKIFFINFDEETDYEEKKNNYFNE